MLLSPGDRVDRYVVIELLGSGGMGEVYRATDPKLARPVALKILHTGHGPGTGGAARMLREARAAAALSHANVLAIFDVGEVQEPESLRGLPYIAMELVVGRSLRTYVGDPGVSIEQRVDWLRDVAKALGAAHRAGIVHRDVKPENVMIRADGDVKVLDFGIARQAAQVTDAWASTLGATQSRPLAGGVGVTATTETGRVVGTPIYMAPEQLRGEDLDGRADQFSWGVSAYSLLTGRLPWPGAGEAITLVTQILSFHPPAPSDVDPRIPRAVSDAIVRALAKEREARFASMEELVAAFDGRSPVESTHSTRDGVLSSPVATTLSVDAVAARSADESAKVPHRALRTPRVLPWRRIAAGVVACAAIAAGAAAYRAAHAPRVHYCLGLAIARDGPRCVAEVGASVVGKRFLEIDRVTERAGRVVSVERVNFAGLPAEPRYGGFERMKVVRDDGGAVRELVAYDHFGAITEWQKWSEEGARIDYVDIDGKTPRYAEDKVTSLRVEYDAAGQRTRVLGLGSSGRPRTSHRAPIREHEDEISSPTDGASFAGLALEYGPTPGVVVKQTSLGFDGKPAPSSEGVVTVRRTIAEGLWGDVSLFDADDRPMTASGVHTVRVIHDDDEQTGERYFGVRGERVVDLDLRSHGINRAWDPVKRTATLTCIDVLDRPQLTRYDGEGSSWVMESRRTFDALGRRILFEDLDSQGNRIATDSGTSAQRFEYDENGRVIREETLDPSDRVRIGPHACARLEKKYGAGAMPIEERCYDEAGHLAPWREGGAITRHAYDERGLRLVSSSFDADDHPVATVNGYAEERWKYDRHRNEIEHAYFGVDGKPTESREGFSVQRRVYDENDDLVAISYFDASGAPTAFESSYATRRLENDEHGLVIAESFLDGHGDPVLVTDGYAAVKRTRDANGDVVEETYRGVDGKPVLREGGFARRTTSYDVTRRPVEQALFDVAGRPVRGTAGWAIERETYDEHDLVARVDHLDADRRPVVDADGRASVVLVHDAHGDLTEETSLDPAGHPVVTRAGYATKKTTYGERGDVVEEALLGAGGKPVSGDAGWSVRRVRYDENGGEAEEAFFGPSREPVVPTNLTYSSKRQTVDERHVVVAAAYFDVRGAPSTGPEGAATVRYVRDGYGRAIETRYFDGMGVPAPSRDGRIVVRSTYDDAGRLVGERFSDAGGSPRAVLDGCFGHATKYDAQGRELEHSCLDTSDAPAFSADGWAVRRTLHDARGNAVEIATYAPDGSYHADRDGIARRESRFDERNHVLETAYFDASGKPAHDRHGVHALRFAYDDSGKRTGQSAFDERDRPVATSGSGAAR